MKRKHFCLGAALLLAAVLTGCQHNAQPAPSAPATPAPVSSGQIDESKAQEIAFSHAGVSATDASFIQSELDRENGRLVYEISWYTTGASYEYEIDAATGEILSSSYEDESAGAADTGTALSEAEAKQTALSRVPGASEADIREWESDFDDAHPEYEGTIVYDGMEYEFTIDAATGAITEWDAESIHS